MTTDIGVDALFRAHAGYVKMLLRRFGIWDTALDDAVQEVFVVVWKHGGYHVGPANPRTWLRAITLRVAANTRRRLTRHHETLLNEGTLAARTSGFDADITLKQQEAIEHIRATLAVLSPEHLQVFLRFYVQQESCTGIAQDLKIPTGTVYSRLHAARNAFSAGFESAP